MSALLRPTCSQSVLLVAAMVAISLSLAFFTYAGRENRKLALYSPLVVPVLAITSLSPFLVANTASMLKSRRTSALCILEWIHCLAAMFHHVFQHPVLVTLSGFVFPLYAVLMHAIKEIDYESFRKTGKKSNIRHLDPCAVASKMDAMVVASVILYFLLWYSFGPVFVVSGAGPVITNVPFVRHDLYASDYANIGLLGFLFVAENLCIIRGAMIPSQVLHFVSHFAISYVFYRINVNHFFPERDDKREGNATSLEVLRSLYGTGERSVDREKISRVSVQKSK